MIVLVQPGWVKRSRNGLGCSSSGFGIWTSPGDVRHSRGSVRYRILNNNLITINYFLLILLLLFTRRFGSIITYARRSTTFIHIHPFFFLILLFFSPVPYPVFCCIFLTFLLSQSQIVQTIGLAFPGGGEKGVFLCHISFSQGKSSSSFTFQQYLLTLFSSFSDCDLPFQTMVLPQNSAVWVVLLLRYTFLTPCFAVQRVASFGKPSNMCNSSRTFKLSSDSNCRLLLAHLSRT